MTDQEDLEHHPYSFDLFRVMRDLERASAEKPRIGDSTTVAEEIVALGQDPFLEFPAANITRVDRTAKGIPRLYTRFLGFFGPQGALPLNSTVEALGWTTQRDPSFARFADLFANRFLQLFFRAWSDARPIAQHDRPADDRFSNYVGAFGGIGSAAFAGRDSVNDLSKIPFAGLVASRIKSARRLAQLLRGVLGLDARIIERVGTWLVFEPADRTTLGRNGSALGTDTVLGVRTYSIKDKFRISLKATSFEQYMAMLPNGQIARQIADLVFFYAGHRFEYDVELLLLARQAPSVQLGVSGQLGWTSWVGQNTEAEDGRYLNDARFDLSERRTARAL